MLSKIFNSVMIVCLCVSLYIIGSAIDQVLKSKSQDSHEVVVPNTGEGEYIGRIIPDSLYIKNLLIVGLSSKIEWVSTIDSCSVYTVEDRNGYRFYWSICKGNSTSSLSSINF